MVPQISIPILMTNGTSRSRKQDGSIKDTTAYFDQKFSPFLVSFMYTETTRSGRR